MHFTSLHEKVTPTAFYISEKGYPPYTTNIIVKLNPTDVFRTMQQIEQQWLEVAPAWPFQGYFLDNKLNELYRQEKQVTRTTNIFSGLAIFLSLMGLFGRDRHPTGSRRYSCQFVAHVYRRICKADVDRQPDRLATGLAGHSKLARAVCFPDFH